METMCECRRCHQRFPATTEYFPPEKRARLGVKHICRPCNRDEQRERYAKRNQVRGPWRTDKEPEVEEVEMVGILIDSQRLAEIERNIEEHGGCPARTICGPFDTGETLVW